MPVICQTNQGSRTLPPLAKGLILGVYGLGTLLIGGVVLSLLGVIPTIGLVPTALTVASGTLVQLVGQPCASFLLILMGLHACAALAYLMRNALSRGLSIKWACQLYRHTNTLAQKKEQNTHDHEKEDSKYVIAYCGQCFKALLRAMFLEETHFDVVMMHRHGSDRNLEANALRVMRKSDWENLFINQDIKDRYQTIGKIRTHSH